MAAFTFATGNVAGLRRLPLYLLGALATFVVPRTDRLWVFGSGIGAGEGALPLYRAARERLGRDVRLVWLATTDAELARARELGLDAERKLSARGLWLTMRARVQVVTHGQGDVNRYGARGGFLVQLWHGIPLKRLHLDSPAALTAPNPLARFVVRRGYRVVGRQIRLFPVSSARVVGRVCSAFGLRPDQVAVTGDPRDDVLLAGTPESLRQSARALLESAVGPLAEGPVVLYAPTWREGAPDPAQPDAAGWREIAAWLDGVDGTLLVRNHPLGNADYAAGPDASPRIRLLTFAQLNEITPILPAVDHLVTDYSSTAFDFALTGGTTVFLAADVTGYLASRGLYEPYHDFAGGRHVASWPHALQLLDALVHGDPEVTAPAQAHARWLRDEHFDHLDGRATERVLDEILARLRGMPTEFREREDRARVEDVRVDADRLVLTLRGGVEHAELDGSRARVPGTVTRDGDLVRVEVPLLVSRWGQDGLALPSGSYRLTLTAGGAPPTTRVSAGTILPASTQPLFRATIRAQDGGVVLDVAPPLTDEDRVGQRALRSAYLRVHPREDAVWFESFYGRTVADNPRAIAAALARTHPEITQYWSVADRSVAVPPGTVPVVERSREWWRSRAAARVLVVNDWLRWTYRPRRGQHVLQTWHGTPLKRLARDRDVGARTRFAALREGRRWDALLAQNDYAAQRLRSAYAYRGPVWQLGYPRNDVLHDAARRHAVRRTLGAADGTAVVLYAPTWRDDRTDLVDALDLAEFAARLPADHLLLVRGHSRTLAGGTDLRAERLLDVTTYPDAGELMLIADALVTDYSSVMFDFAGPMIFYLPDLAHYADVLRGFYFDLVAEAPGPVAETPAELEAALADLPAIRDEYAAKREAWQERFAPDDDGHAAERVVERLFAEGWLGGD